VSDKVKRIEVTDLLILNLVITPLFFLPASKDVFNLPKLWVFSALVVGALVFFIFNGRIRIGEISKFEKVFLLVVFGFLVTTTVSAILSNTTFVRSVFGYPGRSNGLMLYWGIGIVLFISVLSRLPEDFEKRLFNRIYVMYLLFGIYSCIQFLDLDPINWNNPFNPVIGTLGNPNFAGAFLGIGAFLLLFVACHSNSRRFWLLCSSLALLGLAISSGSVQSYGIFFIGLGILFLSFLKNRLSKVLFSSVVAVSALTVVLVFMGLLGLGPLGQALYQYTLRLRVFEYWRVALETAFANPLNGIGVDSYVEGFRLYKGEKFVGEYSESVIADAAHNVLLNFLANFGFVAFFFYLLIVTVLSFKSLRIIFSSSSESRASYLLSYVWLLGLIQSLFSLEQIGLSVYQWICGALLLSKVSKRDQARQSSIREVSRSRDSVSDGFWLKRELSILSVVLVLVVTSGPIRQEIELLSLGKKSLVKGASQELVLDALADFNSFTQTESMRSIYVADLLIRSEQFDLAEEWLLETWERDPESVETAEQLARLARFKGDVVAEYQRRSAIKRLDPFNYKNLFNLAEVSFARNLNQEGRDLLTHIVELPFKVESSDSASELLARYK
jgi:O-antigen ligase